MAEWQPIETAPRDGTVIGVWTRHNEGTIKVVRWGHHLGQKNSQPCWVTITRGISISALPTHWIALDPLPMEGQR